MIRCLPVVFLLGLLVVDARPESVALLPTTRMSREAFLEAADAQVSRLRLHSDLAESDQAAGIRRSEDLGELLAAGHASSIEVESTILNRDLAADRLHLQRWLADQFDTFLRDARTEPLPSPGPSALPGAPVRLKLPGVSRRVGTLEFFTIPLPERMARTRSEAAELPSEREPSGQPEQLRADRLRILRSIPSVRDRELLQAERNLLAARIGRETSDHTARERNRERASLCGLLDGGAIPVTAEDTGPFTTSWRQPVAPTPGFLAASLPLLEARAAVRGPRLVREAEVAIAARRLAAAEGGLTKGIVARITVKRARADLETAQALAAVEGARLRIHELERDAFRGLAAPSDPGEPVDFSTLGAIEPQAEIPAELRAARGRSVEWLHGFLQTSERWTGATLEHRSRVRLADEAGRRLKTLSSHPAARPGELAAARTDCDWKRALEQSALEQRALSYLEWAQWQSVAGLLPAEPETGDGIPASVLRAVPAILEAEEEAARLATRIWEPNESVRREVLEELERLHRNGASSTYELTQARNRWRLSAAKASLARDQLDWTGEVREFTTKLAAERTDSLHFASDLGTGLRTLLLGLNDRHESPRPAVLEGLAAAGDLMKTRATEFQRLERIGLATDFQTRELRVQVEQIDTLAQGESARVDVARMSGLILGEALQAEAIPPETTFELPALR